MRPLLLLAPVWLMSLVGCSQDDGQGSAASGGASSGTAGSGGSPGPGGAPSDEGSCDEYETGDLELERRCLERASCGPLLPRYSMSECVTRGSDATAPCLVDDETCTEAAGELHCAGDILYECIDGVRHGRDCARVAERCAEDVQGQAVCVDTSTPCDVPGTSTCDGNLLIVCGEEGWQQTFDCSTAGLRCEPDGAGAACLAPSCTVADADACTEACDGSRLRYCVGGSISEVDCTEFGFAGCSVSEASPPRAFCVGEADPLADSCVFARDGECDPPPLCDEGTDTTDCANHSAPDEP